MKIKEKIKKFFPFLGPSFIVSVGYIDPGNWATNIQGGADFGYLLLWVLTISNLMAIFLQNNAAKLGIATGKSLAENCREHFSKPISFFLWITAELAALATDLAEFLGAALGIFILFKIPLFAAALIAGLITFFVMYLERYGYRIIEIIIMAFLAIVAISYITELFMAEPNFGKVAYHTFVPNLSMKSVYVAIGMLGATVMPHNIFLHSSLVTNRLTPQTTISEKKKLFKYGVFDSLVAMNLAWFINASMIIMAAAVFFDNHIAITTIEAAHKTLTPLLGSSASLIFAVALLSAGLSSSITGTMAGQIILEGFLNIKIPIWARRIITMIPALIIIGLGVDSLKALIISQVILSIQLPFTIIPLLLLTRNKKIMGVFVNRGITNYTAYIVAAVIITLNSLLIYLAL
jgi:manganese transport protein